MAYSNGNANGRSSATTSTDPFTALTQGLAAAFAAPAQAAAAALAAAAGSGSRRPPRPLIPKIDLAALGAALLGEGAAGDTIADNLVSDDGPPRLFSPYLPELRAGAPPDALPLMFYLPGIDGTGLAAYKQFPRLMAHFDLRCLVVPPGDRSGFEELLSKVEAAVRPQIEADGRGRPVYLMGESFGGLLGLALAERLGGLVDRLVSSVWVCERGGRHLFCWGGVPGVGVGLGLCSMNLVSLCPPSLIIYYDVPHPHPTAQVMVNPATSFADSPWPQAGPLLTQLPPEVYRLLPFGLSPLLCDPLAMARHAVDERAALPTQASDYLYVSSDVIHSVYAI